jgi:hypothetical protein
VALGEAVTRRATPPTPFRREEAIDRLLTLYGGIGTAAARA